MIDSFTESEMKWIKAIEKGEKQLEELSDRKDILVTEKFIQFIEKIIKYENLRLGDPGSVHKRLIRVYKSIPTKSLDKMNFEYVIMNGLYIVQDVMFLDPDMTRKYMRRPTKYTREDMNIPENISMSTVKLVRDNDGNERGVALFKDSYIVRNFIGETWSAWNYPIF